MYSDEEIEIIQKAKKRIFQLIENSENMLGGDKVILDSIAALGTIDQIERGLKKESLNSTQKSASLNNLINFTVLMNGEKVTGVETVILPDKRENDYGVREISPLKLDFVNLKKAENALKTPDKERMIEIRTAIQHMNQNAEYEVSLQRYEIKGRTRDILHRPIKCGRCDGVRVTYNVSECIVYDEDGKVLWKI